MELFTCQVVLFNGEDDVCPNEMVWTISSSSLKEWQQS